MGDARMISFVCHRVKRQCNQINHLGNKECEAGKLKPIEEVAARI